MLAKTSPAVTSSTLPPPDSEKRLWSASHGLVLFTFTRRTMRALFKVCPSRAQIFDDLPGLPRRSLRPNHR
ncbi:unnamed protein product [Dibothriocephalus latus]|uniref:Uncharacterized protein n=1 Tax=Dibothriocephalus latus TaxID=60516 RepID=A0A3P7M0D3_DIBLA|nr:unnamed protein product [Dibothriocephalus latus]